MVRKINPTTLLVTAIIAATIASRPSDAQPSGVGTTMTKRDWTIEGMEKEVRRYRFIDLLVSDAEMAEKGRRHGPLDIPISGGPQVKDWNVVVLSGFLGIGMFWGDLDKFDAKKAAVAVARRDEIAAYVMTLPWAPYSLLADHVQLIKTERGGDWDCGMGYGCYPKGYVVGIADGSREGASELCEMFRQNDWFCAVAVR